MAVSSESVLLSFKRYVTSPVEFGYMLNEYINSGQLKKDGYRSARHFLLTLVNRTDTNYSLVFLKSISKTAQSLRDIGIMPTDVQNFNIQELRSAIKAMEFQEVDRIAFLRYLDSYRKEKRQGVLVGWKNKGIK